jgi:hypothetical protein
MSTKFPSPLLGYNNNVRHKGKVFHIQTEDSGVKYGHIITHLFMDGGRILKSVKTSYTEYIGNERMREIVREMMKQQHKAMFIALRDGKFEPIVEGTAEASQSTRVLVAESPPSKPPPASPVDKTISAAALAATEMPPAAPAGAPPLAMTPPAAAVETGRPVVVAQVLAPEGEAPTTIRQPREELALDIAALERAASAAEQAPAVLRSASDLPPPPANLFREKTATGKYRITPVPPVPAVRDANPARPVTPSPAAAVNAPLRRPSPDGTPAGERRYAPTRPASIFGQARPQQGKTIFGEDLISDKSLDEVILSYLSEDLDDKK